MSQSRLFTSLMLAPILLLGGTSVAQDLSLFEPVESTTNGTAGDLSIAREQRNMPNAPSFTLLGTSRIGDRRRVSLSDSSGEVLMVEISDNESTPIPDHVGYQITGFESGKVRLILPGDMPCITASDKGVRCGADGMAELTLTTAAPIAVASEQISGEQRSEQIDSNDEAQPENPFAAALRAAAQNEANAQSGRPRGPNGGRFEARRIAPEDVPAGMRVVRTPFGDRLVEL